MKLRRSEGTIEYVVPWFLFIFLLVIIVYLTQIHQYEATSSSTEDALAASSLASAVIDIQEYGISHDILVESPDNAYQIYQTALKTNLNLKNDWTSDNIGAISGAVEILDYIIYNVKGMDVYVYRYGTNNSQTVIPNGLGSVEAPDGQLIVSTSIYSRITFPVDGVWGVHTIAEKELLVDIVNN